MADRLENEMKDMEKRREAFNSALETCDQQLHDSLKQLNSSVRSVLYPKHFSFNNAKKIDAEHRSVCSVNREVNSKVEGFQERTQRMNAKFDEFLDLASSLDYFDKWARSMKSEMYEISHIMEQVCAEEQNECREIE